MFALMDFRSDLFIWMDLEIVLIEQTIEWDMACVKGEGSCPVGTAGNCRARERERVDFLFGSNF